jgi:uncharacterized protein YrrD
MSEFVTQASGRKVVGREDAEVAGQIKSFVFDERVQRIQALHVSGRTRNAELVEWQDIVGFGPDAVVIAADRLREVNEERERDAVRHRVDVIGAVVLDDKGDQHGSVRDLRFDPQSGEVEVVIGDHDEWSPDEVLALGTFALVVRGRQEVST